MTAEPDPLRLERQVGDAARRLQRTSGCPAMVAAVIEVEGGSGVAFQIQGLTNLQTEFAHFVLLQRLARELEPGAATNCPSCSAAWARVSAAVEALRPGFGAGVDRAGSCC